jgi:hypothetical protein
MVLIKSIDDPRLAEKCSCDENCDEPCKVHDVAWASLRAALSELAGIRERMTEEKISMAIYKVVSRDTCMEDIDRATDAVLDLLEGRKR